MAGTMIMTVLLGVLAVTCAADVEDNGNHHPLTAYFDDFFESRCKSVYPECLRSGPPCDSSDMSEQEVNEQTESEKRTNCKDFDASECDRNCLLGYETNESGCVISCQCKKRGVFEGDIMITEDQLPWFEQMYGVSSFRAASTVSKTARRLRWPQVKGENVYKIPYVVSNDLGEKRKAVSAIEEAVKELETYTCLRVLPRENEPDYVRLEVGTSCRSYIGRIRGKQDIFLAERCWKKGNVLHELMHAIGFFHEQSRPDRDDCVRVCPKLEKNFKKMTKDDVDSLGSPYDMRSIMHYGGRRIKGCGVTITDRCTGKRVCQQRKRLSDEDIKQINMMYNCPNK